MNINILVIIGKKNKHENRCWVPCEWCNTIKKMSENNSMIIFHLDDNPPNFTCY